MGSKYPPIVQNGAFRIELARLHLRHDHEELVERAQAARHGHERVRQVDHARFARGQVRFANELFSREDVAALLVQALGDHADNAATLGRNAVRHRAHQPHVVAAEHYAVAVFRQRAPQLERLITYTARQIPLDEPNTQTLMANPFDRKITTPHSVHHRKAKKRAS